MARRRLLKKQTQQRRNGKIVVALAAELFDGDDVGPKWVQITREGDFPGYLGGLRPFSFTRVDLEAMVSNIQMHPAFVAGAEGANATGHVIPWDFNHASEASPVEGGLPIVGAPSQGWTLDMQLRDGVDGRAELWALTQFLEPARTYVKSGQYLWASVAVAFDAVHPETGQNIGALITSIALTNTPFVEGMSQLAASRKGKPGKPGEKVTAHQHWFEAARDASEVIQMMRDLFSLGETSGAAEVMIEVAKIQQWLESGVAPLGTDPESIIGSMRIIMNLPALTPQLDVINEASTAIQRLIEEQAAAVGVPAVPDSGDGTEPAPPSPVAASRHKEEHAMDELLKILAAALGVRASEAAVTAAVTEVADLRTALASTFGCRDGAKVILDAAKDGVAAKDKLLGLFAALGVSDPEAALAKVTETIESSAKLLEVMPELEGLRSDKKVTDAKSEEVDVDAAIAAGNLPANVRGALLLQRKSEPKAFAEEHPKAAKAPGVSPHLLKSIAVAGVTPLKQMQVLGSQVVLGNKPGAASAELPAGTQIIDLSMYEGRNPTARAKAHLSSTHVGWATMTNEQQFTAAIALKKQPNVIDGAQA